MYTRSQGRREASRLPVNGYSHSHSHADGGEDELLVTTAERGTSTTPELFFMDEEIDFVFSQDGEDDTLVEGSDTSYATQCDTYNPLLDDLLDQDAADTELFTVSPYGDGTSVASGNLSDSSDSINVTIVPANDINPPGAGNEHFGCSHTSTPRVNGKENVDRGDTDWNRLKYLEGTDHLSANDKYSSFILGIKSDLLSSKMADKSKIDTQDPPLHDTTTTNTVDPHPDHTPKGATGTTIPSTGLGLPSDGKIEDPPRRRRGEFSWDERDNERDEDRELFRSFVQSANSLATTQRNSEVKHMDLHRSVIDITEKLTLQNQLSLDQNLNRTKNEKLRNCIPGLTRADGMLKEECEKFIDDIDLTLQSFTHDKDEAAKYFALQVSSGELKREILKYIDGARNLMGYPSSFTWDGLKSHILYTFVAKDIKEERARQLELIRQNPGESIDVYSRRFKNQVEKTYGKTLPVDIDRLVLKQYLRSFNDPNIIMMMYNGISAPNTFQEAVSAADKIQASLEKVKAIGVPLNQQQQVEFGAVSKQSNEIKEVKSSIDNLKQMMINKETHDSYERLCNLVDRQNTHMAKIEAKVTQDATAIHRKLLDVDNSVKSVKKQVASSGITPISDGGDSSQGGPGDTQRGNSRGQGNYGQQRRGDRSRLSKYRWQGDKPICNFCGRVGHILRNCYAKRREGQGPTTTNSSTNTDTENLN